MTTNKIRAALTGVDMPFLYRDANRAVLLPGLDQIPNANYRQENQDWNNPRILYMENVMPISKGVISTVLAPIISAFAGHTDFDQAIILRDKQESNSLYVTANGANYILAANGTWSSSLPFTPANKLITRAYTQGRTFVCYSKEKIFEFDGSTNVLVDRTSSLVLPAGFAMSDIRGIGGASNYLLLFTKIEILWSNPNDPLNFNRLLNNGSGYQVPQDLRGQISCILPVAGGAIAYTVRNAVAIVFTNNAATPFIFRGISNSGGVASYEQVAYDADEQFQYIWGSGGLQAVNLQSATNVYPELADFLTSGVFEYYDYVANKVVSSKIGSTLAVKLTYVSQRFLVVSYGRTQGSYEYAYILDTVLKRWGKVKVDHTDSFTFPYPNINGDLTYAALTTSYFGLGSTTFVGLGVGIISISPPKKSIAFLTANGAVSILSIDYSARSTTGVIVLGQIQQLRDKYTTLHEIECEGLDQTVAPKVLIQCSANGKAVDRVVQYSTYAPVTEDYQSFQGRETAVNFNVAVVGAFQLTGMLIRLSKHGKT